MMKSIMTHDFARIERQEQRRSLLNRDHGTKLTFNAGDIVPMFVEQMYPGDTFNLRAQIFTRMTTPVKPIMDNLTQETFYFFVPYRLVWEHWKNFMGEKLNPGDSVEYNVPQIENAEYASGSLGDYMFLPTKQTGLNHNSLIMRAHNLIYNEWFRHQKLQDSVPVPIDDGPDSQSWFQIYKRTKRHDYFTSCLPAPQEGEAVTLPLGSYAPVVGDGKVIGMMQNTGTPSYYGARVGETASGVFAMTGQSSLYNHSIGNTSSSQDMNNVNYGIGITTEIGKSGMRADLSEATAATVNSVRFAFQMQRLLERDMRGGNRYIEQVLSHFGIQSPDLRATRPVYLGGSRSMINITPIAQTSESNSTSGKYQGDLAGFATNYDERGGFSYAATEHGVVLGYINIRADVTYQQGIERHWFQQDRFDFYYPVLANIGEQAVLSKEIYFDGTSADEDVFGYQEAWSELRYKPSRIAGMFRSNHTTSLDVYHLSDEFGSRPVLNDEFIEDNTQAILDRCLTVTSSVADQFQVDIFNNFKCARVLPIFSTPGMIDHF